MNDKLNFNPSIEDRLRERVCPSDSPVMYQKWSELLFLHWSFDPKIVAETLPEGLFVDTFGDKAWIGLVPFFMEKVRPRFLPSLPSISNFQELNLRTYVVDREGRPGVWFYSLDTPHHLPNWIARRFFHLNYQLACMSAIRCGQEIIYQSCRHSRSHQKEIQTFHWSREGSSYQATPNSLEFFLVERYRLFSWNPVSKICYTGKVHHQPYPIQDVDLKKYSTLLFSLNGLKEPIGKPVSVLASKGVPVTIYPLKKIQFTF